MPPSPSPAPSSAPPQSPPAAPPAVAPASGSPASGSLIARLLVYSMFFASGAAGLIYEVTWTRQLLYTFGSGLYAVSAVLAAFMAGLALGSFLLGRVSDRLAKPLAVYGGLELIIGLCGFVIPGILGSLHLIDGWAYARWGQDFGMLTTFRLILALAALIVPTTLMGATLPVLTRYLVRDPDHVGLHVGALYAINTFGAVAGAFAAGFLLIEHLGLRQTQWTAAGFNFAVAIAAVILSTFAGRIEPSAPREPNAKPIANPSDLPQRTYRWILLTAMLTGCVSLAAQVLWTRTLVFSFEYLKNTTYAFSAMLTIFLAGLAIGSALIGLVIDQLKVPLRLYGLLLLFIGASISLSALVSVRGVDQLRWANPFDDKTNQLDWLLAVANIMLQTIAVMGLPTLLMGMAFPVAARLVLRAGRAGGDVGALYSLNTLGAIVGSIAAAFFIIPHFGLTHGLLILGAIDGVLGLATILIFGGGRNLLNLALIGTPTLVFFGLVFLFTGYAPKRVIEVVNSILGKTYIAVDQGMLQPLGPLEKSVFYREGPLATVAVVENHIGERTIYVDGVGVAGTDAILQTDQKSLAHVPMMLLRRPESALTVGFGAGGASYSLLRHDRLTRIDCVEICRTVLEAAPNLKAANHLFFGEGGLLPLDFAASSQRYRIILDDARAWLRYTSQRYDFIATDCTDLRYKSNANLYDVEYFQACRDRLTPEGVVVVWMPLAGLSEDVFKIALRTFHKVFPAMGIFFMDNEATHYILLVGWQDKIKLDYQLFQQTLAEADVKDDLAELRLDDPVKLLSCFITGGDALTKYLGDGPINTENHPLIEFESPKYGYGDRPVIDNLDALMKIRVSPLEYLDPKTIPDDARERLLRYEKALPYIIDGHAHYRLIESEGPLKALEAATRDWMKAAEIAPEDISVKHLLLFPVLTQRMGIEPNNETILMLLGRVYMIQGDPGKLEIARDALQRAEALLVAARPKTVGPQAQAIDSQLAAVRSWLAEIRRQTNP